MTGKEIASAGAQLPALPEGKGLHLNIAGIPIPLRRTFAALDRLIALPIEALGDKFEKKLKGNIDSHVDAVQKKRRSRGKKEKLDDPSIGTTKRIADWAEAAAEVDPNEAELSAVWRSILDEILDDSDDAADLLEVVNKSRASDVRFFLRRYARHLPPGDRERRHPGITSEMPGCLPGGSILFDAFGLDGNEEAVARLKANGLVRRRFSNGFLTLLAIMVATLTVLLFFPPFSLDVFGKRSEPLVIAILIGALVSGTLLLNLTQPSTLGKRLCELYNGYADER